MAQQIALPKAKSFSNGWLGIAALSLAYLGLYLANLYLPLEHSDYTSRIWNWSQTGLALLALAVVVSNFNSIKVKMVAIGFGLGVISGLSHGLHDPSLSWMLQEGLAVWVCFVAGATLFQHPTAHRVPGFQSPLGNIARGLFLGILVAIPLAVINNLYFFASQGKFAFQPILASGFEALSPAIHEEIIFRFFVLALCFSLLRSSATPRLAMTAALALAVVPHSLNHLPDLFLDSPGMGLTMLVATSLLFGFPMAYLQVRKNLESAIAFHWLIDFARFLFGY